MKDASCFNLRGSARTCFLHLRSIGNLKTWLVWTMQMSLKMGMEMGVEMRSMQAPQGRLQWPHSGRTGAAGKTHRGRTGAAQGRLVKTSISVFPAFKNMNGFWGLNLDNVDCQNAGFYQPPLCRPCAAPVCFTSSPCAATVWPL